MSFCFRIRCTLGTTVTLSSGEPRWILATNDSHGHDVFLAPAEGETIGGTREIVIRGSTFNTHDTALATGQQWLVRVKRAFSKMNVGADFGERGTAGVYFDSGLRMLEDEHGGRMLNDFMGLTVFECEPAPIFARVGPVTASVGKGGVLEALSLAAKKNPSMSPQEEMAYSLYSASFNESHADARFVMLMMAIETLLPEVTRPDIVLEHVERLSKLTETADLPDPEKRSLIGSLKWLRLQSVNQSGRQLASTLGSRSYMEGSSTGAETPIKFFTRCYEMRSALVHGHYPRPTRQDVGLRAAHLERFVGDLLAGDIRAQ